MGFLGELASQLNAGENTTRSLHEETIAPGYGIRYGLLGDFANKFDKTSERKYLEEGYLRRDAFNSDSKQFELIMQEPNATVLVKKRMFSSLADNHKIEYMDKQERLYYKASTLLFQNKCTQIAALEKLSKIQKVVSGMDQIDDQVMSLIFTLGSSLNFTSNNPDFSQLNSTLDRIRRIYAFNKASTVTNWITDSTNLFRSQFGQGTGVIELTNFTQFNTTTTTGLDGGNFSLTISDPYEAMVITEFDIEKAISDAGNYMSNSNFFQTIRRDNERLIETLKSRLNNYRKRRGASEITISVNPDTLLGRRVTAIIDGIGLDIPFEFEAFSGSAILAGLDSGGDGDNGVKVPKEYLIDGDIAGFQGLSDKPFVFGGFPSELINAVGADPRFTKPHEGKFNSESELKIFQSLIGTIYSQISLEVNSRGVLFQSNETANYVRRKLRFNFLGKLIVQPMDTVNIYVNSKTQYDNSLLSGLKSTFSGFNFIQKANSIISKNMEAFNSVFNPSVLSNYAEKAVFVGPEFPNFLWAMLKPQFVNEKEGTHVFAGVVTGSSGTWSGDKFTVSINGNDNAEYLTMGRVNFKPGVDAWAGKIYDPLTPFKTSFDTVSSNYKDETPELLDDNRIFLGDKQSKVDKNNPPLAKFKSGGFVGQSVTGLNYIQDRKVDKNTKQLTRTFYAPDGLVYKWKEGIGSFVQFGSSLEMNDASNVGNPSISQEPFAGQDIMNVISLLVTGHPYNFATYWKAVSDFNSIKNMPSESAAQSFYTAIRGELEKRNALWGNFVPFKNLIIDENSFAKAQQGLFTIIESNNLIENNLKQLNDLEAQSIIINLHANVNALDVQDPGLQTNIEKISTKYNAINVDVNKALSKLKQEYQSYFDQVGDDITFDFDNFMGENNDTAILSDPNSRRSLRRKVNFLTRRMSYNVRSNEDKNLFIVDDFYDKDFDIAAFNSALAQNFSLYNNEFWDIKQKIKAVANLLNLEVFCDTQGHIRVRPPQYNRMPSSIFHKMMFQKKVLNVQVFPQFLIQLFEEQLTALGTRLEILEDEIRLDCALLDLNTDREIENFIVNPKIKGGDDNTIGGGVFTFISDSDGIITDYKALKLQANPVAQDSEKKDFKKIEDQVKYTSRLFTSYQKFNYIKQKLENSKSFESTNPYNITEVEDVEKNNLRINELVSRIEIKSGQKVSKSSFYVAVPEPLTKIEAVPQKYIDIFKVVNDLSKKVSQRQKILKSFYDTLTNASQFESLDDDNSVANKLLSSGQFYSKKVPEVFEHMIQDETYDDYGPNSGQRYIIKNSQIKSYTIKENPPELTYVEVRGTLNPYNPQLPDNLRSFPGGGNGLVTAAAIDYDLWRSYGWRDGNSSIEVPFLNDPVTQCAPYAVSILSRARKNILQGSLTIVGNEYMQPGEVIYLENRGLLFYVTSVNHSFSYNGSFTTTLSLSYGHSPGEYIPTAMDVIGKMLYRNKDAGIIEVHRNSTTIPQFSFGALIIDPKLSSSINLGDKRPLDSLKGSYGKANSAILNNIAYNAKFTLYKNNAAGNNVKSKIELRIYTTKDEPDSKLKEFADIFKGILTGEIFPPEDKDLDGTNKNVNFPTFNAEDVLIVTVKLVDENEIKSPSSKAWAAVRGLLEQSGSTPSSSGSADEDVSDADKLTLSVQKQERKKLIESLTKYIIDCWIITETIDPSEAK